MDKTDIGDRMKEYERMESGRRLMPRLPACIRVDGRSFSRMTRGLGRPYDRRMSVAMAKVAKYLAKETGARCAYTQSDEISLVLHADHPASQLFFGGKIQKMVSVIAAMASVKFNQAVNTKRNGCFVPAEGGIPELCGKTASFDCRVWNVPSLEEAANCILWRELDATRNSVQSAARAVFSHKQCVNKNSDQLRDMLSQEGAHWDDYPGFFKRGTYFIRREVSVTKTRAIALGDEPSSVVCQRRAYHEAVLPPLRQVRNRVEVLFYGAEPETDSPWEERADLLLGEVDDDGSN